MKAKVTFMLSLLLVLALFGCGPFQGGIAEDNGSGGAEGNASRSGKQVSAPVEFFYTIENPLEIITEKITERSNEEEGIEIEHNLVSISGLLDKEVEKKINDRIMEAYEKIKSPELPPFRGIKAAIPEDALLVTDYIHEGVSANYNNLLSISLIRQTTYSIPDAQGNHIRNEEWENYDNQQYVSVREGLTFDLNTGEEITLADVFADNVDYLPLLNDLVTEGLNMNRAQDEEFLGRWYGMGLAAPFRGLSPDQKFFLEEEGINLIIDYNMPEFYMRFGSWVISLSYWDMGKTVAITKRFYDEDKNIYTSQAPLKKSLLDSGYSSVVPLQKLEYEDGRVGVYSYVQGSPQFPEKLKDILLEESQPPQKEIDELNRIIKNEGLYRDGETSGYYEQQVSAGLSGRYATLMKRVCGEAGEYRFFQRKYLTWDADTGDELTLADMFREGFDYRPLLRKAFKKSIDFIGANEGLYLDGRKLSPEESEQQLDKILSGEISFSPTANCLRIAAGEIEFSDGHKEVLHISLSFDEIGYENLAVFDEK